MSVPAQKCVWSLRAESGSHEKDMRQEDGSGCFSRTHISCQTLAAQWGTALNWKTEQYNHLVFKQNE